MFLDKRLLCLLALMTGLTGCDVFDDDDDEEKKVDNQPVTVTLVHINDHHSHLAADDIDFTIDGKETEMTMGGFSRVVSKINDLTAANDNVLKLHSGDAITGTLFYTLFEGEADAAMMNQVCFDAFALGNHEFDAGDAGLATFLDFLNNDSSCQTPTLAANVKPEVGVSPLALNSATDYIQPYVVKDVDGARIGLIGIDIADKTLISSNPDDTTQILDETTTAQAMIDELQGQGVNKIVLMTHYQYQNDIALAQNLRGVDVIVGGDSHSLLGNNFLNLGLNASGEYPTVVQDLDGETVCIVQAWQYSNVVGELQVEFDAEGKVTNCNGTPHLLVDEPFIQENDDGEAIELTGEARQQVIDFIDSQPEIALVQPDADTEAALAVFSAEVDVLTQQVVGSASENLCYERVPGQGRSSICSAEETLPHGGDITQLVAQAFLEQVGGSDISIQNAGGIRIDIAAGELSIATIYELLPFSNTMVQLQMTGAEIKQALEEGVSNILDNAGSSGAYPYAANLRWNIDMNQEFGGRFSNLEVKVDGNWQALGDAATYVVVTNSFAAGGGDGYSTFADVSDSGRATDTFLEYAQTFVDYVERVGAIEPVAEEDYSTQSIVPLVVDTPEQ